VLASFYTDVTSALCPRQFDLKFRQKIPFLQKQCAVKWTRMLDCLRAVTAMLLPLIIRSAGVFQTLCTPNSNPKHFYPPPMPIIYCPMIHLNFMVHTFTCPPSERFPRIFPNKITYLFPVSPTIFLAEIYHRLLTKIQGFALPCCYFTSLQNYFNKSCKFLRPASQNFGVLTLKWPYCHV
jgi:hypothetical protein